MSEEKVPDNLSCVLYDWVSFTCKNPVYDPAYVKVLLGLTHVSWDTLYTVRGYKQRYYFGGISIHYEHDDPDQSLWVEMSGAGCRAFETFGNGDYDRIFRWLSLAGDRKLTRLDVAFDDRDDLQVINLRRIWYALEDHMYVSRSGWSREDGSGGELTVYLGSRKSDYFFRLYDKAVERGLAVPPVGVDPSDFTPPHWVRLELQMRDDVAWSFVCDGAPLNVKLLSFLSAAWRFIDYPDGEDQDRRRWPTADFWSTLVDGVQQCNYFVRPGVEYNFSRLQRNVLSLFGPSTLCYIRLVGFGEFARQIEVCQDKMLDNPKYKALLNDYGKL